MADYTYDCRNRLVKVTEEDETVTEYEYDAENTRTAEIKNGTKTVYVTEKEASYSQILQETEYTYSRLTGTGKKLSVKTYTYGAGLISEHKNGQNSSQDSTRNGVQGSGQGSAQDDTETLYYHYNHLGSTTAVTDKTGSIRYRFAYGTYGELAAVMDGTGTTLIQARTGKTVQECLNEAAAETGIRFLYNGKYGVTTEQNGLYYMRARYYNTDIKRFINRDVVDGSIENGQSLNKYSYVQGNPVNLTDPFGLSPVGGDDDDSGGDDDDDIGGWLGSLWDKLDPDIKHLIKSMIPGYGAYMQFAEAEEYRERGDYFNAVRSATGALANVALTAAVIAALGIAAPAMMVVVLVTSAVVYCSDVATSCYNYGTKVSKGISELMETGGISPATMEEVREAETQAKISLFFGILGAGAIDSCLAKMTTAKGVAGSATGSNSDELVHVYRGTDRHSEISAFKETGQLMSEATRNAYFETGNLNDAYARSSSIHNSWLKIWGNENNYVQAHGAFGTELSQAFGLERTYLSVTTDPNVARGFAGREGRVFEAYIPKSQLIEQTLGGAGESEYLIKFGFGGFK